MLIELKVIFLEEVVVARERIDAHAGQLQNEGTY